MAKYLSFTSQAAADEARSLLYDRVRLTMIALGDWTDGGEPISAWPAATQDAHTGRWLVQSAQDYLADQFAAQGGLSARVKPLRANLSGVAITKGSNETVNLAYFFPADQVQRSELASDVAFIDRSEPVVVGEVGRHFDRKAVKRNGLVKVEADARTVAA